MNRLYAHSLKVYDCREVSRIPNKFEFFVCSHRIRCRRLRYHFLLCYCNFLYWISQKGLGYYISDKRKSVVRNLKYKNKLIYRRKNNQLWTLLVWDFSTHLNRGHLKAWSASRTFSEYAKIFPNNFFEKDYPPWIFKVCNDQRQ